MIRLYILAKILIMKFLRARKCYAFVILAGLFVACKPSTGHLLAKSERLSVYSDSIPQDTSIQHIVASYKVEVEDKTNRIIGYAAKTLENGLPESELNNFVSDLLLEKGIEIAENEHWEKPAFAFSNNGGMRTPITKGAITVGDVYRLMPFENRLVILGFTKDQLHTFLDEIAANGGEGISGIRFTIDHNKATEITIGGEPIDAYKKDKVYMLTSDYLANGGGGELLKSITDKHESKVLLRDAIMERIEALNANGELVDAQLDGRIKIVG